MLLGIGMLIATVLAATALVVADVWSGGKLRWLKITSSWQALLGAMLGLMAGAGVLALQAALTAEAEQTSERAVSNRLEQVLAMETRELAQTVAVGSWALKTALADGTVNGATCVRVLISIARDAEGRDAIFDTALSRLTEISTENLLLFVRFRDYYKQYISQSVQFDPPDCASNPKDMLAYASSAADLVLSYFPKIASQFGLEPVK